MVVLFRSPIGLMDSSVPLAMIVSRINQTHVLDDIKSCFPVPTLKQNVYKHYSDKRNHLADKYLPLSHPVQAMIVVNRPVPSPL